MGAGEIKYAKSGDGTNIAYEVDGGGDVDLLYVPPAMSNLEVRREDPHYARALRRLSSFSRLISLDKRGSGVSDRTVDMPTPEQQVEDLLAVLDAVGSESAYVFGSMDGAVSSLLLAAAHPSRVRGVVAYGGVARMRAADERDGSRYEVGYDESVIELLLSTAEETFASPALLALSAPSVADDESYRRWWAKHMRASSTPSAYAKWLRALSDVDIREALPHVRVPVLVPHRRDDVLFDVRALRWLADHLPYGRFVELPGRDYQWWIGEVDAFVDEVKAFVTGSREAVDTDRVLATVVFTDIVDSTVHAARLGDVRWAQVLDLHDGLVRSEVERWRGRVVKSTGDGALATFDGPARAVRCANALRVALAAAGIDVRVGVHAGEVEMRGDDVGGIAVHIAARVQSLAQPGEVLVSRTVADLVAGSGLAFDARGAYELKGVPGEWQLFALAG